jgi:hypothetical protein
MNRKSKFLKFIAIIFSLLINLNFTEAMSAELCSSDVWSTVLRTDVLIGRTNGATVESSRSGWLIGIEGGAGKSISELGCFVITLRGISGMASFVDRDFHSEAILHLKHGLMLHAGGQVALNQSMNAEIGASLGAAKTSYTTKTKNISLNKTAAWGGRIGDISAGIAWNLNESLQLRSGANVTHIVTGAGQKKGNPSDLAAEIASNDSGKAVNLNIIGAYFGFNLVR